MTDFTPGKWCIASPIFDGDAIFAPPQHKGRRYEVIAMGIMNKADAKLITEAPTMYMLLKDFINPDIPTDSITYQVLQIATAELINNIERYIRRKENSLDYANLDCRVRFMRAQRKSES